MKIYLTIALAILFYTCSLAQREDYYISYNGSYRTYGNYDNYKSYANSYDGKINSQKSIAFLLDIPPNDFVKKRAIKELHFNSYKNIASHNRKGIIYFDKNGYDTHHTSFPRKGVDSTWRLTLIERNSDNLISNIYSKKVYSQSALEEMLQNANKAKKNCYYIDTFSYVNKKIKEINSSYTAAFGATKYHLKVSYRYNENGDLISIRKINSNPDFRIELDTFIYKKGRLWRHHYYKDQQLYFTYEYSYTKNKLEIRFYSGYDDDTDNVETNFFDSTGILQSQIVVNLFNGIFEKTTFSSPSKNVRKAVFATSKDLTNWETTTDEYTYFENTDFLKKFVSDEPQGIKITRKWFFKKGLPIRFLCYHSKLHKKIISEFKYVFYKD